MMWTLNENQNAVKRTYTHYDLLYFENKDFCRGLGGASQDEWANNARLVLQLIYKI